MSSPEEIESRLSEIEEALLLLADTVSVKLTRDEASSILTPLETKLDTLETQVNERMDEVNKWRDRLRDLLITK